MQWLTQIVSRIEPSRDGVGEYALLSVSPPCPPAVVTILDIGAHAGLFGVACRIKWPSALINTDMSRIREYHTFSRNWRTNGGSHGFLRRFHSRASVFRLRWGLIQFTHE